MRVDGIKKFAKCLQAFFINWDLRTEQDLGKKTESVNEVEFIKECFFMFYEIEVEAMTTWKTMRDFWIRGSADVEAARP